MNKPEIIVARVSQGMGHFRRFWVGAETPDGWVCGVPDQKDDVSGGYWFAPQNIIYRGPAHAHFDYNDIQPGTLVNVSTYAAAGMVVSRNGANYQVMVKGELKSVQWRDVCPLPCDASGA